MYGLPGAAVTPVPLCRFGDDRIGVPAATASDEYVAFADAALSAAGPALEAKQSSHNFLRTSPPSARSFPIAKGARVPLPTAAVATFLPSLLRRWPAPVPLLPPVLLLSSHEGGNRRGRYSCRRDDAVFEGVTAALMEDCAEAGRGFACGYDPRLR